MPKMAKPASGDAAKRADEAFYRRYPDRKSKPITSSPNDGRLRDEWLEMYKQYGGKVKPRVPAVSGSRKTTLAACMNSETKPLEVYVYMVI